MNVYQSVALAVALAAVASDVTTRRIPNLLTFGAAFAAFAAHGYAAGWTGVGLSLGPVVEQAVLIPITLLGIVMMALLAYTIFTITLVVQRKEAARGLALGLVSLTVPAVPLALLLGQVIAAIFLGALGLVLYRGLREPRAMAWLDQP